MMQEKVVRDSGNKHHCDETILFVPFHVEEGQQVGSFTAVNRKKLVSKQAYEYIYTACSFGIYIQRNSVGNISLYISLYMTNAGTCAAFKRYTFVA